VYRLPWNVEAVRAVWPESKPIGMRVSATDWVEGGWTPEGIATEAFGQMKEKFFPVTRSATSPQPAPAKTG